VTIQNPPLWIDGGSYTPELDRTLIRAMWAKRGIVGPLDLLVHQTTVAGLFLEVDGGLLVVDGTTGTYQGRYLCENRGVHTIGPLAPGDGTNPRKDRIIARVDETANDWDIEVVQGTPNPSPAEPALPADAFELALLDVPAGDSTFTTGQLTDRRWSSGKGLANVRGAPIITTGGVRPTSADMTLTEGQPLFDQSENRGYLWNGSAWVSSAAYGLIVPNYYNGVLAGGAALTNTTWANVPSIMTAPFPLVMEVEISGTIANTTGFNIVALMVNDQAGVNITKGFTANEMILGTDTRQTPFHIIGSKDVAAGATCGFLSQYRSGGGGWNINALCRVSYIPKTS
jgi:hypothetical protein